MEARYCKGGMDLQRMLDRSKYKGFGQPAGACGRQWWLADLPSSGLSLPMRATPPGREAHDYAVTRPHDNYVLPRKLIVVAACFRPPLFLLDSARFSQLDQVTDAPYLLQPIVDFYQEWPR